MSSATRMLDVPLDLARQRVSQLAEQRLQRRGLQRRGPELEEQRAHLGESGAHEGCRRPRLLSPALGSRSHTAGSASAMSAAE